MDSNENEIIEQEAVTVKDDVLFNIGITSQNLVTTGLGTKERDIESQIYERQQNLLIKYEQQEIEKRKVELMERKDQLMAELEAAKIRNMCTTNWCNVGINVLKAAIGGILAFLSLKFNMVYGGMNDRDAKGWIKDLLKG